MRQHATFESWDFAGGLWDLSESATYPYFIWQALGPFAGAVDAGGGWKWLAWFGYFKDGGGLWGGWIWHAEHGWLYTLGTSPSNLWFWSQRMSVWLWTGGGVYPFFWNNSASAWWFYYRGTGAGSGGWFYNYGTGHNEWH